jgi:hypothetical protein
MLRSCMMLGWAPTGAAALSDGLGSPVGSPSLVPRPRTSLRVLSDPRLLERTANERELSRANLFDRVWIDDRRIVAVRPKPAFARPLPIEDSDG